MFMNGIGLKPSPASTAIRAPFEARACVWTLDPFESE